MTDVSNSLYYKSPLDTLVRQSSRRAEVSPRFQPPSPIRNGDPRAANQPPVSPLLHTRFRASASTAETSFMDLRGDEEDTANTDAQEVAWNRDDGSVYSSILDTPHARDSPGFRYVIDAVGDHSPTLPPSPTPSSPSAYPEHDRQSWASHSSEATVRMDNLSLSGRDTWRSSANAVDPFAFRRYESPSSEIPRVVVSSPVPSVTSFYGGQAIESHNWNRPPTRPSITQYNVSNFSRPIRRPTPNDEQSKREVLERNRSPGQQQQGPPQYSNLQSYTLQANQGTGSPSRLPSPRQQSPRRPPSSSGQHLRSNLESENTQIFPVPTATNIPNTLFSANSSGMTRGTPPSTPSPSNMTPVRLPNTPPSPRPVSRVSVYSTYSYYQLDDGSRAPSPALAQPTRSETPHVPNTLAPVNDTHLRPRDRSTPQPPTLTTPTAEDYLILGIQHHEGNRLAESATCFERAATLDGGCGVGMLMWGLSLRHAWGTEKDEKSAFRWLRRAAEAAVGDLEAAREGKDQTAVKTELVLAIYEVGQCFFHGWGVAQDKKMAVSYFQVAARLGDADAQQELGYCLANGKGCKKNLKEAAKWYRAAAAQGASTVGLTWIYKPKYN